MTISDDVDHSGWFPVPCSRTIRTHKRHFGNLPGFWNKTFQEEDEPKEVRSELYDLLEEKFFCCLFRIYVASLWFRPLQLFTYIPCYIMYCKTFSIVQNC